MANELVHASVGTELTQAEWESVTAHILNSQATGDLIYASSATQLSRLAIGASNTVLRVSGGVPGWSATLAGLTLTAPTINGTVATTGLTLPAFIAGGTITGSADINLFPADGSFIYTGRGGNPVTSVDRFYAGSASGTAFRVIATYAAATGSPSVGLAILVNNNAGAGAIGGAQWLYTKTAASDEVRMMFSLSETGTLVNQFELFAATMAFQKAYTLSTTAGNLILNPAADVVLGIAGTNQVNLLISGATSGTVTVAVAAAAGTWTMTLPTTGGTNGYSLTTDGAGVTTWTNVASLLKYKNLLPEDQWLRPQDALDRFLSTRVAAFQFKPGMGTGDMETRYDGIIADADWPGAAPWATHYEGGVFNPINAFGNTVLAIQAQEARIAALETELAELKAGRA